MCPIGMPCSLCLPCCQHAPPGPRVMPSAGPSAAAVQHVRPPLPAAAPRQRGGQSLAGSPACHLHPLKRRMAVFQPPSWGVNAGWGAAQVHRTPQLAPGVGAGAPPRWRQGSPPIVPPARRTCGADISLCVGGQQACQGHAEQTARVHRGRSSFPRTGDGQALQAWALVRAVQSKLIQYRQI